MAFKEYKISKDYFIKGWYIPKKICDDLIKYFNDNYKKTIQGIVGTGVNKNIKESTDLCLGTNNTNLKVLNYRKILQKLLDNYIKKFPELNTADHFNVENLNIQKYPKKGGFKTWHYERAFKKSSGRTLVFMTYLNTVNDGGTCFKYQSLITPAEKGLTLIWPPDFTHTHKGQITNEEKMIITGWFKYT
jgi:hypothetical protein|tara:strand:- start:356 stop:922 length:567 start_codon:yes stop_codon:yes gene_type:complete